MEELTEFEGENEGEETPTALKEWGLREVWRIVGGVLAGHCYPELYRQKDSFHRSWGFKSLLEAMYLQMMWLMTATGQPPRCKWTGCPKFITLEQPEQSLSSEMGKTARRTYRTRRGKEFCSNACKNRWHYHYGDGKYSKSTRRQPRTPAQKHPD